MGRQFRGRNPRKSKVVQMPVANNGVAQVKAPEPHNRAVVPNGAALDIEGAKKMGELIKAQLTAIFQHNNLPSFCVYFTVPIVAWRDDLIDPQTKQIVSGWGIANVYHIAFCPVQSPTINSATAILAQAIPGMIFGGTLGPIATPEQQAGQSPIISP